MKKPKILIVDDSKPILCLLEVILGKKFDVFAANDGFSAMNWLMEGNKPDLIISDLQMPNIDGVELITYLSGSDYYNEVPVLVLSGADESEVVEKYGKLQIAGYVSKPFDPAELVQKIEQALRKSETAYNANGMFRLN
ncbi:MAG: response regulator [Chitinophagaceae bacterium]|jgi:two-component system chemotaxis response regulator CheY|nr:MAG: response regulator [Chitinophagaceae bacterium]